METPMFTNSPRIVIAALKGGSGKTILSLGLTAAWRKSGLKVAPFKKGPDFIDAGWLAFSAERPCYNLDPFLMDGNQILNSFHRHSGDADLSLIEGNRGLYDGMDLEGSCSTAELAKLLRAPVIIIVDVTMTTRTVAAIVKGCQAFDPDLNTAAVILNRVAGPRQEQLIRNAIETYCGIPVVGSVPKLKENLFPERHMGLVPHQERGQAEKAVTWTRMIVEDHLDLEAVGQISRNAGAAPPLPEVSNPCPAAAPAGERLRIGYMRDSAFWFYYPENIECLGKNATLIELDALVAPQLPELDALYIGGGFPETQAEALADNSGFRRSLKKAIDGGLPVYAECGGFMYLGETLHVNECEYPMVGALPVDFMLKSRPQGHGYTVLEVERSNPYFEVGERIRGHEFHYSKPELKGREQVEFVFRVERGHGVDGKWDGIRKKNLLATYTHVHAGGSPWWAERLLGVARAYHGAGKNFSETSKRTIDNPVNLKYIR